MDIASLFDTYSRKARLTPALFALLAPTVSVAIWVPGIYERVAGLVSILVVSGVLIVLANLSRYLGHKVQNRLQGEWGALPSVMMLRHRDANLDPATKQRYHHFLESNIDQLVMPTVGDEEQDPAGAEHSYISACKWLLERTRERNRFDLLFKENVEYGFRRNMRGLKPIGLVLSGISTALGSVALYSSLNSNLPVDGIVAVLLSAAILAVWTFVITDEWVHDAAKSYAIRLLAACDQLP